MGTISQEVQSIKYGAGQFVSNAASSISNLFQSIVGGATSFVEGMFTGDVVGINTAEIPNMKNAIDTYCDGLAEHLKTMKSNATTDEAFKGSYAGAVTEFIQAVEQCCNAVISNLKKFEKTLDEVSTSYTTRDTDMASDITAQAEELKSSYQAYSEGDQ